MKDQLIDRPLTIGDVRADRAIGILVRCPIPCRNLSTLSFGVLKLPDETPFAEITTRRRLRCHFCDRVATPADVSVDRGPLATWGKA